MVFLTSHFSEEYEKAYHELLKLVESTEELQKKLELYDKFSEDYSMLAESWMNVFQFVFLNLFYCLQEIILAF